MARALNDGIASLKDRDFSVSVTRATHDEMGDLVTTYNDLGDRLRVERQSLYQRELMLDTVIQTTPLALVLTNEGDAVLYSNAAARQLFGAGRKLEGERFVRYLDAAPVPLREAIERGGDTLFTLELGGEPQVYHVSQRRFLLNALPHRLLLLKQLTREINSQEVATWKKVIRVIAHELNNSLAPISSLAHSGQILARAPPDPEQMCRVFATIEERARHLAGFIEGYSQFAKLPQPRVAPVAWDVLLERSARRRAVHAGGQTAAPRHQLRRRADRAGTHQPAEECARVGLRARPTSNLRSRSPAEVAPSRYAIAALDLRRRRWRMRWCRSIRPSRPARDSGSRCAAKLSKRTGAGCGSPIAKAAARS